MSGLKIILFCISGSDLIGHPPDLPSCVFLHVFPPFSLVFGEGVCSVITDKFSNQAELFIKVSLLVSYVVYAWIEDATAQEQTFSNDD